jgi:hypothetical protein
VRLHQALMKLKAIATSLYSNVSAVPDAPRFEGSEAIYCLIARRTRCSRLKGSRPWEGAAMCLRLCRRFRERLEKLEKGRGGMVLIVAWVVKEKNFTSRWENDAKHFEKSSPKWA